MGKVRGVLAVALLATGVSGCWLQAGFGPGKTGASDQETTVTPANVAGLTEAWSVTLPAAAREPLVMDGVAYVRTPGAVTALDLATGATLWSNTALPGAGVPALADGALRVPTDGSTCTVTSLALADGAVLGSVVFGYFGGPVVGVPMTQCWTTDLVGFDGRVAASASSTMHWDLLHCGQGVVVLDGEGALQGWSGWYAEQGCPLPTPPTFLRDVVVRPSAEDGWLRAYPEDCGSPCTEAWSLDTGPPFLAPAVAYGVGSAQLAVTGTDGNVRIVSLLSPPRVSSTVSAGAPLAFPVTVAAGIDLLAATTDGRLVALRGCDGCQPRWEATLTAPASARVSVGGQVAYVGSTDGTVAAFADYGCDAPTCEPLWTANVGAAVAAPPVIDDGTLLVAAADGSLTAFTLP